MTENFETSIKNILDLSENKSFQNDIAQIRAKALLREIADPMPQYDWKYPISTTLRNIIAETFELERLSASEPSRLNDKGLQNATYQFALAWESISKLEEGSDKSTSLLNAALSYELAGYQANAACLARKMSNQSKPDELGIVDLVSLFLQRFFIKTIELSKKAIEEPDVSGLSKLQMYATMASGLAAKGLTDASLYFLNGDSTFLVKARERLHDSEKLYSELGAVSEFNIVRSMRNLIPLMKRRSTWELLVPHLPNNDYWNRYLKLLARGLGTTIMDSPSVSELWPSQINALDNGLFESSSKVVKMPTSAGKTRVAEMAIVHTLLTFPGAKCVYVAPYRALVAELEHAFLNLFGDLGFNVSSIIGAYESDDFEEALFADADILVLTPEKLDLLQRAHSEFLQNVRLFVLDEGQIINDRDRGVKFELLFTRLKRKLVNARFLFLSAVVPEQTLQDFAHWFRGQQDAGIITSKWRPSIQRFAQFKWDRTREGIRGKISYHQTDDIKFLQEFVPGVVRQHHYGKSKLFPETANKSQTAAELAYKFAELGPVLVFCSQGNFVRSVAKAIELRINYSHNANEATPAYFLGKSSSRSALMSKEWLGDSHPVSQFLSRGIGVHYGDLPGGVKNAVENDFRDRKFQILVATNTLAQGVNLPIRTVIIHSCWRRGQYTPPERISARDYWNIAGRAGRAGEETEGTIIHIVNTRLDEKDFQYYLERRHDVEPVESRLFILLESLLRDRITEENLIDALNPEILALLVEEGNQELSEQSIEDIVEKSYASSQMKRYGINAKELQHVFKEAAGQVVKLTPDGDLRRVYSATGLCSASCEAIRQYVTDKMDMIEKLAKSSNYDHLGNLIDFYLESCLNLSEMRLEGELPESFSDLLKKWIRGESMERLVKGSWSGNPEDLSKFIEEFFSFRLPWGISAVTRISTKMLGLERSQLSDYFKFFPSMVKYGVSSPAACWAMASGVPYREAAMLIAAKYLSQTDKPESNQFREWISKLSHDTLSHDFKFEGHVLEDVSKAISRAGSNPLLKQYSSITRILPLEMEVKGIYFLKERSLVAMAAREGQDARLVREYGNRYDRNAIQVQLNGQMIGYIERQLAQLVAPEIDCGLQLVGKISRIVSADVPRIWITLSTMLG